MKKFLILSLTMFLIGSLVLFAGAQSESGSETTSTSPASTEKGYTLPIVKDGTYELTYFGIDIWYAPVSLSENLPVWLKHEEETGVKINWEVKSGSQYWQALGTRMAAGKNLPDMFACRPQDVSKYINDGVAIRLDDLLEQYAPNITKFLDDNPGLKSTLIAPDGHIYNLPAIKSKDNPMVPGIRTDWLEQTGLEIPETPDDWYQALQAFRDMGQDIIPITFGQFTSYTLLGSAWDIHGYFSEGWSVTDDDVVYDYMMPKYKEFLTFLNKLYTEKCLDQNLFYGDKSKRNALIGKNVIGASNAYAGVIIDQWNAILERSGFDGNYVPVLPPKDANGNTFITAPPMQGMSYLITKDCERPDIAVKWADYLLVGDGHITNMYGLEGKTYTMQDGKPKFTEWVMQNPDGLSPIESLWSLGAFPSVFYHRTPHFDTEFRLPEESNWIDGIREYFVDPYPLGALKTAEESETLAFVMTDVITYVEEMFTRFVTGNEPLSNFDKYVERLKDMGIEDAIAVQQTVYDRVK